MNAPTRVLAAALIAVLTLFASTACGGDDAPERPGVALPSSFPAGDVPLVEGAILSASDPEPDTWQVTVQANAADGNSLDNAIRLLTDSGYEISSRVDEQAARGALLSKKVGDRTLWVNVGLSSTAAAGATSVIYQVTRTA